MNKSTARGVVSFTATNKELLELAIDAFKKCAGEWEFFTKLTSGSPVTWDGERGRWGKLFTFVGMGYHAYENNIRPNMREAVTENGGGQRFNELLSQGKTLEVEYMFSDFEGADMILYHADIITRFNEKHLLKDSEVEVKTMEDADFTACNINAAMGWEPFVDEEFYIDNDSDKDALIDWLNEVLNDAEKSMVDLEKLHTVEILLVPVTSETAFDVVERMLKN